MIEQKSLFKIETPQKKSFNTPASSFPTFPKATDLLYSFDQEAMMWLRMSADRGLKAGDQHQFLQAIQGEMNIKSGRKTVNLSVKEALLSKTFA
jgi:hypothetical protein